MTRSDYLRQIEDDYAAGKIDDDAMDTLYLRASHMEFDPEPDDDNKNT